MTSNLFSVTVINESITFRRNLFSLSLSLSLAAEITIPAIKCEWRNFF